MNAESMYRRRQPNLRGSYSPSLPVTSPYNWSLPRPTFSCLLTPSTLMVETMVGAIRELGELHPDSYCGACSFLGEPSFTSARRCWTFGF